MHSSDEDEDNHIFGNRDWHFFSPSVFSSWKSWKLDLDMRIKKDGISRYLYFWWTKSSRLRGRKVKNLLVVYFGMAWPCHGWRTVQLPLYMSMSMTTTYVWWYILSVQQNANTFGKIYFIHNPHRKKLHEQHPSSMFREILKNSFRKKFVQDFFREIRKELKNDEMWKNVSGNPALCIFFFSPFYFLNIISSQEIRSKSEHFLKDIIFRSVVKNECWLNRWIWIKNTVKYCILLCLS